MLASVGLIAGVLAEGNKLRTAGGTWINSDEIKTIVMDAR